MFPLRDTIPSRRPPVVMWLLILANGLAFVWELRLPAGQLERVFEQWGIVPARVPLVAGSFLEDPRAYLAFLTSMFLHGGLLHVLANLWTLSIFGDNVEDRMGPLRFLGFYLVTGIAAGLVHVWFNPASAVPTIGASGAISGVMGAYFVLYPRAKVLTLFLLIFYPVFVELPAVIYLGFWFVGNLASGTAALAGPVQAGGIAFLAHVGGFLAGVLLHRLFLRPR